MRLHRLRLEAFGPFAAPQEIDFDRVGASGLFLLEGPTGAGKSSILDAITFALYGGLAGRDSGTDRQRSHFAGPLTESHVQLEFSVRGVRHRIRRTPEWLRPKRRGEGVVKQAQSVHLERDEGGAWASLSSNKAEVGELIAELLGLNRDQFTQVVLLPQGEFAEFLRAGDDDRRQLLTKIFGTHLYDAITAELTRRRTAAQQQVDLARGHGNDRLSAAAEAAGLSALDSNGLLGADDASRLAHLCELAGRLAAADVAAAALAVEQAANRQRSEELHLEHQRRWELAGRHRDAEQALHAHRLTLADHERDEARLAAAGRAGAVVPLIRIVDEQAAAAQAIRSAVLALAPDEPDLLTGRGAEELSTRATEATRAADALTSVVELERTLPQLQDRLSAAQLASDAAAKRLDQLRDREAELPALVSRARTQLAAVRDAVAQLGELTARRDSLAGQAEAAAVVAELAPRAELIRADLTAATDLHQRAVDGHQRAVDLRLRGMAAELAGQLEAGAPCAVCGSPAHPAPARRAPGAVSAADVDAAGLRRTAAEAERERIEREFGELTTELAGHRARAGVQPLATLLERLREVDAALDQSAVLAATRAEAEATLTEREVEKDQVQLLLQHASADLAGQRASTDSIETETVSAARTVESARADFVSVAARQADLRTRAEVAATLVEAIGELERSRSDHEQAIERAGAAAVEAGFAGIDAARAAGMAAGAVTELERRVQQWQRTDQRLRDTLGAEDLRGIEAARFDSYAAAARESGAALEQAIAADRAARTAGAAARDRVDRFALRRTEYDRAAGEVLAAERAGADVIHLAALARGTAGHRRTNLTTYVLRHWFERVVDAANSRLTRMSSGRYALVRTDSGSRATDRAGLTLRVIDLHTGEERGTTSISGGETFYTSLALALGLADVVTAEAGGVELDTLFIDEGFGTLDAETLDHVMAVIDELRDHGRVVGIVSHVAELKDRVQERIEVRRLGDGSSGLRVLA